MIVLILWIFLYFESDENPFIWLNRYFHTTNIDCIVAEVYKHSMDLSIVYNSNKELELLYYSESAIDVIVPCSYQNQINSSLIHNMINYYSDQLKYIYIEDIE